MKVAVLTNKGSIFGEKIIDALISNKVRIAGIVVIKQPLKYYLRLFKSVKRRVGVFSAVYFSLKRIFAFHERRQFMSQSKRESKNHSNIGVPVFYTRGTNSPETLKTLKILCPDILILGQTGIVEKELLEIPIIGTLNAHPGILPYYRGIDCAKWAIFNDEYDKIGVTVHWVSNGVDTGNIILKEIYNFYGDETVEVLNEHLYDLCVLTLTKVILQIQNGSILFGEAQSMDEGIQYHKMSMKIENVTEKKLKDFLRQMKRT